MRYRVAGTSTEEGHWQGVGLLVEGRYRHLLFVTMRDHGRIISGDLAGLAPQDHPLLEGMEVTEIRDLDTTLCDLVSERFIALLKRGPGNVRRRKSRTRPQIDVRAYADDDPP